MLDELPDEILICIFVEYSHIFYTLKLLSLLCASCKQFAKLFEEHNLYMKITWIKKVSRLYPVNDCCNHKLTIRGLHGLHRAMDICTLLYHDRYRFNRFILLGNVLNSFRKRNEPIGTVIYSEALFNDLAIYKILPLSIIYFFSNITGPPYSYNNRIDMICYDYYPNLLIRICIENVYGRYEPRLFTKRIFSWIERKWDLILFDFPSICFPESVVSIEKNNCIFNKIASKNPLLFHKKINISNKGFYEV